MSCSSVASSAREEADGDVSAEIELVVDIDLSSSSPPTDPRGTRWTIVVARNPWRSLLSNLLSEALLYQTDVSTAAFPVSLRLRRDRLQAMGIAPSDALWIQAFGGVTGPASSATFRYDDGPRRIVLNFR